MSKPPDSCLKLCDTLSLCEYKTGGNAGFWLYDDTRGMNLAMCAKSERDAFVKALGYYQTRLADVEREHKKLRAQVDSFVGQFVEEDDDA